MEGKMFEISECVVLANRMNDTLQGKTITGGDLGNSPHKFVWYNRSSSEFENLINGKSIGRASAKGRWLLIPVKPGYTLVLGECGVQWSSTNREKSLIGTTSGI